MATRTWFAFLLSGLVSLMLAGCSQSQPTASTESAEHEHGEHDHADHDHEHGEHGHDHAGHEHNKEEIDAQLAKLSPEQREIAKAQDDLCPVSGEPLGEMGAPVLVKDVDGHDVLICCAGCEDPLRKEPAKFLAKLKKAEAEAPK